MVAQFQVGCAAAGSRAWSLVSVLEAIMEAFPFGIRGFHSANGSEDINHQVAHLLEQRRIEQITVRAESNHASAGWLLLGARPHATPRRQPGECVPPEGLSPALHFPRPCHGPTDDTDTTGRRRKRDRLQGMMPPRRRSAHCRKHHALTKPGTTLDPLVASADDGRETGAVQRLNEARTALFQLINNTYQRTA
jgi:hypothetical protein